MKFYILENRNLYGFLVFFLLGVPSISKGTCSETNSVHEIDTNYVPSILDRIHGTKALGNSQIDIGTSNLPSELVSGLGPLANDGGAFQSRPKRAATTRAPRPPMQLTTRRNDQKPKPRPLAPSNSDNNKLARNQRPEESTKNAKFSTQHLFNPKQEAKRDGRKWDSNPSKWTKKQWNTFYSSRAKTEPGLKGKSVNTFVVAHRNDFSKSARKGEKASKDPSSNLKITATKFRAYTAESDKKGGGVSLKKAEFGKVVVGMDSKGQPGHFEKMAEGSKTINDNVKKWKDIKPKKVPKAAKVKKVAQALRGGNKNSRRAPKKGKDSRRG